MWCHKKRGDEDSPRNFIVLKDLYKENRWVGRILMERTMFSLFRQDLYDCVNDAFIRKWLIEEGFNGIFFQFRPLVFTHEAA
jgi:hypothetical protein